MCEGSKTEPNYFEEIRRKDSLSSAFVVILPSDLGTDPISVVTYAEQVFYAKGKAFEHVYAVFDRDDHRNYANAIHMAAAKNLKLKNDEKQEVVFEAVVSVPCFELWPLLHFQNARSWIHRDTVLQQLRVHIPDYEKGMSNLFEVTESAISVATPRAESLRQNHQRIPGNELYTDVHELVKFLTSIKSGATM